MSREFVCGKMFQMQIQWHTQRERETERNRKHKTRKKDDENENREKESDTKFRRNGCSACAVWCCSFEQKCLN